MKAVCASHKPPFGSLMGDMATTPIPTAKAQREPRSHPFAKPPTPVSPKRPTICHKSCAGGVLLITISADAHEFGRLGVTVTRT